MHQQRLNEVFAVIDGQRDKIQRLHNEYYTAYDAAFDENGLLPRSSDGVIER